MFRTEVDTTVYEFEHSKKPRGTGHWAFATTRWPGHDELFWHNGAYGDAKQAAREHFKSATTIYLQP